MMKPDTNRYHLFKEGYAALAKYADRTTNKYFGDHEDWVIDVVNIRTKGTLGRCYTTTKQLIEIDIHHFNESTESAVRDTILHECAHALAGIEFSRTGRRMAHGQLWKRWARILGCNDKSRSKSGADLAAKFAPKEPKWTIVSIPDNGRHEVVGHANRKLKNLRYKYPTGRRHLMGTLRLIETSVYNKVKSNDFEVRCRASFG